MTDRAEDMVERVASAIEAEHVRQLQVDNWAPFNFQALARAAIEGMRSPTETMIVAGNAAVGMAENKFVAMIDAALNPGHPHV